MPRYYCDYCDAYLTHDSPSVRKQHNYGFKHKANVRNYYSQFESAKRVFEQYQQQAIGPGMNPMGLGRGMQGPPAGGRAPPIPPGPGRGMPPAGMMPHGARGAPPGAPAAGQQGAGFPPPPPGTNQPPPGQHGGGAPGEQGSAVQPPGPPPLWPPGGSQQQQRGDQGENWQGEGAE